jgi:hypothetical protein
MVQMGYEFSPKKSKERHAIFNNPGYLYNMKGKVLRSKKCLQFTGLYIIQQEESTHSEEQCFFCLVRVTKDFEHTQHLKGFSPV